MSKNIVNFPLKDVYISSKFPYKNFHGSKNLLIGKYQDTIFKTLIQFDLTNVPRGYDVRNAELILYINENKYPSSPKLFNIYQIIENFDKGTVTFDNQPLINSNPICNFIIKSRSKCSINIDISRLFNLWYENESNNYGLLIEGSKENQDDSLVSFYSTNYIQRNHALRSQRFLPKLDITLDKYSIDIDVTGKVSIVPERNFESHEENSIKTSNQYNYSNIYDVSIASEYTYFVKNIGSIDSCDVFIQISPNGRDWINDSRVYTIKPMEVIGIAPKIFSRFTRLAYKSSIADSPTSIDLYLQLQS